MTETTLCPKIIEDGGIVGTLCLGECTTRCAACGYHAVNMGGHMVDGKYCYEYDRFVHPKEGGK